MKTVKSILLSLIYPCLLLTAIHSCGPSKEELDAREDRKNDSIKELTSIQGSANLIDVTKSEIQLNSFKVDFRGHNDISIDYIIIDECKYIILQCSNQVGLSITHAGNCDNTIHNK